MLFNLKMQIVCFIVLACLAYSNYNTRRPSTHSSFIYNKLFVIAFLNIIFDVLNCLAVNGKDNVPYGVIHMTAIIFMSTLILFVYYVYCYISSFIQEGAASRGIGYRMLFIPASLAIFILIFGKYDIVTIPYNNYVVGIGITCVILSVLFYWSLIAACLFRNWVHVDAFKRKSAIQVLVIIFIFCVIQWTHPASLVTSIAVMLILLTMYLSMDNPGDYIEKGSGSFNQYAFVRIVRERFHTDHSFTVLSVVLEDWDSISASIQQSFRDQAIHDIYEYITNYLKLDSYHAKDNVVSIILSEGKGVGRVIDQLEQRFSEKFLIHGDEHKLHMHICRLTCPKEASDETEVLARIDDFANEAANKMAYIDSLTGVRNRNGYEMDTSQMYANRANFNSIWCILADVNNLKKCNDTLGHEKGDILIQSTAKALLEAVKKQGVIYRIGGDEFVVMLVDFTKENMDDLMRRIEFARQGIDEACELPISFAIGYAKYNAETDQSFSDFVKRADDMMYENKRLMKEIRK